MSPSRKLGENQLAIKRTFASNCLHLVVTSTVVVMSVIKIIIGAEFVHACPLEPILPVYVVVSGCLPVFLSALRDPYERGGGAKYDNSSYSFMMGVAVLGILVNTAWLVAGSAWVYSTWTGIDIRTSFCKNQSINTTYLGQGQNQSINTTYLGQGQNQSINATYLGQGQNQSINATYLGQGQNQSINATYLGQGQNQGINTTALGQGHNEIQGRFNTSAILSASNETGLGMTTYSTSQYRMTVKHQSRANVTYVIAQNRSENNGHVIGVDMNTCESCDRTLLMFACVCVVVDWTCLAVGALYLSYRCCKAFLWVKVEFRKIVNTNR